MAIDPNDPRFWQAWGGQLPVGHGDDQGIVGSAPIPLPPGLQSWQNAPGPVWVGINDYGYTLQQGTPYYASQPYYNEYGNPVPPPNYANDEPPSQDWEQRASDGPYGKRAEATQVYVTPPDPNTAAYAPPAWPYGPEHPLSAAMGEQPDGTGDWEVGTDYVDDSPFGRNAHWWENPTTRPRRRPRPFTGIPWLDNPLPGEQVDF